MEDLSPPDLIGPPNIRGRFAIPQDLQWRTRAAGTTGISIPTSLDGYPRSVFRVDVTRGAPEGQGSI